MIIMNYRNKKYSKYFSVYINVKIVEILKYDLSYMRCYIVISTKKL